MGTLTCSRCKATTEADSIDEGRSRLDHGIGIYKGKPCEDGKAELFFTGNEQKTPKKTSSSTESQSKVKKTIGDTIKKSKEVLFKSNKTE